MDSRHGKIRMEVEGDRLSNLPDDLILKILYFIGSKKAVRTSVLSSRWRYIWMSMTCLSFSNEDFRTLGKLSKFVTHLLSSRNSQIEVFSVKLNLLEKGSPASLKRLLDKVLKYALSHNVQQLNIMFPPGEKIGLPLSFFSSKSLKHLTLTRSSFQDSIITPCTWELPSLATLSLCSFTLYGLTDESADLFSNCANLKNLTLDRCNVEGLDCFNISHPGITDITLEHICNLGNVVTPKLKNLTIRNCIGTHLIFAPNLASLQYESYFHLLKFSSDLLHLDKADIWIHHPSRLSQNSEEIAHEVVCLLQQLHTVKILTLNLNIIKILSAFVELISHQPSPFANLKRLKVHPGLLTGIDIKNQPNITMSTEVKNYLLDGSPGAAFTMVSREETIAARNVASALGRMNELQVLLDQWKEKSERNTVRVEQDKATIDSHMTQVDTKMKLHTGETTAHIESYWKDLNNQLKEGRKRSVRAASMLEVIEEVVRKLPASHLAKLQPKFSSLCAEVDTIMDDMMHHLKSQCDRKPRFKCLLS